MITIFNRREVAVTMSMAQQVKIKEILAANNIDYIIKTDNASGQNWSKNGSLGINMDYAFLYYIYVHKTDYEKASYLLESMNRQ